MKNVRTIRSTFNRTNLDKTEILEVLVLLFQVFGYPMGVGNLLMSGCFGKGYQPNDPCYKLAIPLSRCVNQIDAANFIGVGFDVTGSYTSESRYVFYTP